MRYNRLVLPFFLLFFFLLTSNAYAFTQFNNNPDFTTTQTGYNIINSCQVTGCTGCTGKVWYEWWTCVLNQAYLGCSPNSNLPAFSVNQNATGGNASGVLLFEPSVNCTWTGDTNDVSLFVTPRSDTGFNNVANLTFYSSMTNFNDTGSTFTLPKNQEGIIVLKWVANDTTDFSYGESYLEWYDSLGGSNSTYFSGTWTNWVNTTLLIPADIYNDRQINIFANWKILSASAPISILIDRFSFYTYDMIQPRASAWTGSTDTMLQYCGSGMTSQGYELTSATLPLGSMMAKSDSDLDYCCAYQSGNFTIARRCVPFPCLNYYSGNYLWASRDLIWMISYGSPTVAILIKKINPINTTHVYVVYDSYDSSCPTSYPNDGYLVWNTGSGSYRWSDSGNMCGTVGINLNKTIAGTGSKVGNGNDRDSANPYIDRTNYTSFPNFQYLTSITCTCTSNIQLCTDETGTIATTNCDSYGCDSDGQYCAFPAVVNSYGYGTFCYKTINPISTNTRGYIFYNSTIVSGVYGTCALDEYCFQWKSNQIQCKLLSNNTTTLQVDENGNNVTIEVNATLNPTFFTNPAGSTALMIGGLFGITDLGTSEFMASIIFSLILALILPTGIMIYLSKGLTTGTEKLFFLSWVSWLIVFVKIGWFDPFIWTLLIISDVLLVTGLAGKLIHGGT
jgi:hypothetical protein